MAHHLLIARFTFSDVPLRLFDDPIRAEEEARRLNANPSLLETKWIDSLRVWPASKHGVLGDFVGVMVLKINKLSGYPKEVTLLFDSTEAGDANQGESVQPAPVEASLPSGCIEITDPNHKLRPHVDFYRRRNWSPGEWMPITETDAVLISDWSDRGYRFACPATHHPDLQGTPVSAETDELKVLREANEVLMKKQIAMADELASLRRANADLLAENNTLVATRTQLHKTVGELLEERAEWMANNAPALEARYRQCERHAEELQAANANLRKENDHLQAEILILQTEIGSLHTKMQGFSRSAVERNEKDEQAFGILRDQNSKLHRLNEDLNHRLNATLARASHATDLEARIRAQAMNFVRFHAKLRERRVWSASFGAEKQMSPAYGQALVIAETAFADLLLSFLQSFPHVQPDMPDEWQIDFQAAADDDDDDGMAD